MTFAPGRSGNPNGRPAGSINRVSRLSREAALEYAPAIVKELARIALNDENLALRIAAGKEILDRAYGKPRQQLDGLAEDRLEEKIRHREEHAAGSALERVPKRRNREGIPKRRES